MSKNRINNTVIDNIQPPEVDKTDDTITLRKELEEASQKIKELSSLLSQERNNKNSSLKIGSNIIIDNKAYEISHIDFAKEIVDQLRKRFIDENSITIVVKLL